MYAIALVDKPSDSVLGLFIRKIEHDLGYDLQFTEDGRLVSPTYDGAKEAAVYYDDRSEAVAEARQLISDNLYGLIIGRDYIGQVTYSMYPDIEADIESFALRIVSVNYSFDVDDEGESEVTASSIGEYVGRRLMTTWTVDLLVYGAEESELYDFEQSYTGNFNDCLNKAYEYFDIIEQNAIDGYVTLQANNSDDYYEFYNYSDIEEQFPDEF